MTASGSLPVTVVSGFLGAGKTTLLRRLLRDGGGRMAVVESELGGVAVDDELLAPEGAGRVDVVLGRSCWEAREELVRRLHAIAAQADEYDHLLIETSGVAHPGMLAALLLVDSALRQRLPLDGIVTVVDAAGYPAHAGHEGHADEQVAWADAVVINKTDLVSIATIDRLLRRLRRLNARARYFVTSGARVPVDDMLHLGGFDFSRIETGVAGCHVQENGGRAKRHEIATVVVTCDRDLVLDRLRFWLEAFIAEKAPDLFRIKGIMAIEGVPQRLVLQVVHRWCRAVPGRLWGNDARISRLVFIGRGLDRRAIEEGLAGCEAAPTSRPVRSRRTVPSRRLARADVT
jgi:G3E family GTPase